MKIRMKNIFIFADLAWAGTLKDENSVQFL
jgi:hypothetical protein